MPPKIYATDVDEKTLSQFESCANCDFVVDSALMPDAHAGYVAPIGAVLVTSGKVVPSWVGYDIGCGMAAWKISGVTRSQLATDGFMLHTAARIAIPMGKGEAFSVDAVPPENITALTALVAEWVLHSCNKKLVDFVRSVGPRHLGTLGSGNHFIELGYDADDAVWLIIHSGSRGVGHKIASHYMRAASLDAEEEATFPLDVNSTLGAEYLAAHDFCVAFARENRRLMGEQMLLLLRSQFGSALSSSLWVDLHHNHVSLTDAGYVHRKGATPAGRGERGIIPANMRDGTILVEGKGADSFLQSASHGAGRVLSRSAARATLSPLDFKTQMEGVIADASEKFIDEAPDAYKDIDAVLASQSESVAIIGRIKPLINWKG